MPPETAGNENNVAASTAGVAQAAADDAALGRDQGSQTEGATAESPAAGEQQAEAPKTPLEAVKAALEKNEAAPAEPEKKPEPKASDSPTDEPGKDKDTKDGANADDKLPFHTHPRFKQLLKERNEATEKAKRLDTLLDQVAQLDLDAAEYDTALNLAAMAKRASSTNDPRLARELIPHVSGIVAQLQQIAGETLPDDLQEMVDIGAVSLEQARETASLRRENDRLKRETEASRANAERAVRQTAAERQSQLISEVEKTLSDWEKRWASSDPDYGVMQPLVEAQIVKSMQEKGAPKSRDEAVALAEDAKKTITKLLAGRITQGKTTVKGPSGGNPNGSTRPVPQSPREVTRLALGGAG